MVSLAARPDLGDRAARWFSAHWGVPEAEYWASIQASLAQGPGVPQWYVTLSPAGEIVAGVGLIPQDFHDRPDLTPNLCALFVEEAWRGQGLARRLVERLLTDAREEGYEAMLLDTFPFLSQAIRLYRALGFYEIPRYNSFGRSLIYMQKDLKPR